MSLRHLFLTPLLGLTLVWSGCQSAPPQEILGSLTGAPTPSTVATALPETSLYLLEGEWQDQDGQSCTLRSLRGRPQVVAMIYGGCQGACPRIIGDLKAVEQQVQNAGNVGFLLVTMDPEVDSPERLKALGQEFELGPQWRLLRGTPEQVSELAAVLGVKYRKISDKDYAHSNTITVLDGMGNIAHQKEALGENVNDSAQAVQQILESGDCCLPTP